MYQPDQAYTSASNLVVGAFHLDLVLLACLGQGSSFGIARLKPVICFSCIVLVNTFSTNSPNPRGFSFPVHDPPESEGDREVSLDVVLLSLDLFTKTTETDEIKGDCALEATISEISSWVFGNCCEVDLLKGACESELVSLRFSLLSLDGLMEFAGDCRSAFSISRSLILLSEKLHSVQRLDEKFPEQVHISQRKVLATSKSKKTKTLTLDVDPHDSKTKRLTLDVRIETKTKVCATCVMEVRSSFMITIETSNSFPHKLSFLVTKIQTRIRLQTCRNRQHEGSDNHRGNNYQFCHEVHEDHLPNQQEHPHIPQEGETDERDECTTTKSSILLRYERSEPSNPPLSCCGLIEISLKMKTPTFGS
ncbi:Protein trichome birefringence-like 18 [Senna tora]|uniref:Protein trichome birefringence-like 18 n=1 Tax=Senna tora TaxID=362788 RepID=A0A834TGY2_9FABA|nr:Protein trichome birefringence-like 18 [Senna tora]